MRKTIIYAVLCCALLIGGVVARAQNGNGVVGFAVCNSFGQNLYYSLSLHLVYLQNNHTIPDRKCQVLMYLRARDSFITSFDLNPIVFRTHAISIFKYF